MITSLSKRQTGPNSWLLTAVSDTPGNLFYWWKDGAFLGSSVSGARSFTINSGSPQISVFDDSGDAPEFGLPDHFRIQWDHDGIATEYRVQHNINAGPDLIDFTIDAAVKKRYEFVTQPLADCTEHDFVITGKRHGTANAGQTIRLLMVRRPDPPVLVSDDFDEDTGVLDLVVA